MEKTIAELNAEFMAHKSESDRRHTELYQAMRVIEKDLESKVPYRTFMLIFTILSGVLGYMIWQINDIQHKTTETAEKVSAIETVFRNINLKIEN